MSGLARTIPAACGGGHGRGLTCEGGPNPLLPTPHALRGPEGVWDGRGVSTETGRHKDTQITSQGDRVTQVPQERYTNNSHTSKDVQRRINHRQK